MEQYKGALSDVLVLDLTRVLAGPFSTMMLADMGASVIKIENPDGGDDTRSYGPYKNGESMYYMNMNRNKKGVTMNLKNPDAKEMFLELVRKADVVVENYRPGTMEKLGLGYDVLKEVNPKIIYACVSGFGHYGPYSQRPGYDIIAQAMGGLMSTTGFPETGPTRTGTAMGDVLGGLSLTIGILSALHHQKNTGIGQKVDVALVDSVVASMEIITQIYITEGKIPERIGNRYESTYPYDTFKTLEGEVVIGAANEKLYRILAQVMDREDLINHPLYQDVKCRKENHVQLKSEIEKWSSQLSADEIVSCLLEKGVPSAPIYNLKQVVEDDHIANAREMFVDIDHKVAGKTKLTGCHVKMSETNPTIRDAAPCLGEHNEEVYGDYLNLSKEEIEKLKERGAI
ncbi:MAG: CoA transferase [Erysipelotrichaceae bacterium]|nr:CoA transferase [Erysipelotrichaceae bacterium]